MVDNNIVELHEAIAAAIPDRECIVWRDRRLTWGEFTDRSRRFAHALMAHGVGGEPRPVTRGWESPHDHIALYLTNGNEYLEAMLGSWKARAASINVNYRYTGAELAYLLGDSHAVAVVYHARFAPALAAALAEANHVRVLVVVDDDSDTEPIAGSIPYEEFLVSGAATRPPGNWSADDRYVVYTGGTTGSPKGVLWRQGDFLVSALGVTDSVDDLVAKAQRPDRPRALPVPPFMHGAAHWNALSCWFAGGTVVIQSDTERFDAADVLDVCASESVTSMLIVGDAFARPLLDEQWRQPRDLHALRTIMTGGAILSPTIRSQLIGTLPHVRVLDVLGSSETGRHGLAEANAEHGADAGVFAPSATTAVLSADRRRTLGPDDTEIGWLAQIGRVPRGYLGDQAKTEETFPTIDGVVHAVAGDRARMQPDGRFALLGRDSVTINTGGEKVHAEEVEAALKQHASVYDTLVVGRPSARWGSEIVAVVAVAGPADAWDQTDVEAMLDDVLARYKHPKAYIVVDTIRRSASGKPDYAWARELALDGNHPAA